MNIGDGDGNDILIFISNLKNQVSLILILILGQCRNFPKKSR